VKNNPFKSNNLQENGILKKPYQKTAVTKQYKIPQSLKCKKEDCPAMGNLLFTY
jgi:hypothetical protein